MTESPDTTSDFQGGWTLSKEALQRLLNWLGGGAGSDGQAYVEIRRRLRDYFARKNCLAADDLADETLTRVARRLEEEGITRAETPARYCYIVARFVFLEYVREAKTNAMVTYAPDEVASHAPHRSDAGVERAAETADTRERLLARLETCLEELDPLNRRIITRYYIGSERVKIDNRRELAASLGISMNALAIRASRIRKRLEACVRRRGDAS